MVSLSRSQGGRRAWFTAAVTSVLLGLHVLSGGVEAHAQGSQMVRQLEEALTRAVNKYDTLQLQAAERELEDAINQAHRFNVTDPVLGRLHVMLGIVRYGLTQDENDAYDQFVSAIEVDGSADIHPDYQTPTLQAIMDRARAAVPPKGNGGNGGGEPEVIGRPEMTHIPVETATFGKPIDFTAEVPQTVPLYRISLSYRRYGEREFKNVEMRPDTETRFTARIPAEEVRTGQIDYFIEVLDRTGKILVSSGGPTSPLNIVIFGSDGNDLPDDPPGGSEGGGRQWVYIQALGGGGFGFATAPPRYFPELEIVPGLAPAPFHVYGELGLKVAPSVDVGVLYRFQVVEQEPLFAGLRGRWWFDDEGDVKLYTGVNAGYGRVRHTVNLAPVVDFVDTTAEGPFFGGVNFGVAFMLASSFGLILDFHTIFLFPELSAHLDGSFGVRAQF